MERNRDGGRLDEDLQGALPWSHMVADLAARVHPRAVQLVLLATDKLPSQRFGSGSPDPGILDLWIRIGDLGSRIKPIFSIKKESLATIFWVKNTLILCQVSSIFFGTCSKNYIVFNFVKHVWLQKR